MEDKNRINFKTFYDSGTLVNFSDSSLEFIRNKSNTGISNLPGINTSGVLVGNVFSNFTGNGRTITIEQDKDGNITGYKFIGFPGSTPDGKPTQETIDSLIEENKNNPSIDLTAAINAAIRENHGISFMQNMGDGRYIRPSEGVSFDSESTNQYIEDHIKARNINNDINNLQDFISDNPDLREANYEDLTTRSNTRTDIVGGTQTEYPGLNGKGYIVTRPFTYNGRQYGVGDEFDIQEQMGIIFKKNGITDEDGAKKIAPELDQIRSGLLTRDPKDGYRVNEDGTISGATPGKAFLVLQDEGVRYKSGIHAHSENSITVSGVLKGGKLGLQYLTGGVIAVDGFLGALCPIFSVQVPHALNHFAHSMGKVSTVYKTIYEIYNFFAYGGKKTTFYNNPITPFVIYSAIKWISGTSRARLATRISAQLLRGALTSFGLAAADGPLPILDVAGILEIVWIVGDLYYGWYKEELKEKKKEERKKEDIKNLESLAEKLGCLKKPFVQSGGTKCYPCQKVSEGVMVDESTGKITTRRLYDLPIGVETDSNGNTIYDIEEEKIPQPDGSTITIKRYKPRYIWRPSTSSDVTNAKPSSTTQEAAKEKLNEPPSGNGQQNVNDRPTFGPYWQDTIQTCFPRYINILTPNGERTIESLNIGDFVISFDKKGELFERKIVNKFVHGEDTGSEIYRYFLSDGTIIDTTENHPFLTKDGFKEIGTLNIGDTLINVDNYEISIISKVFLNSDTVYNIEVDEFSTYIANGIRVHNKNAIDVMNSVENLLTPDAGTISLDIDSNGNSELVIVPGFNNRQEAKYSKKIADGYIQSQRESWVKNEIETRAQNRSSVNGVDTTITGPLFGSRASGLDDFKNQISLQGTTDPSLELDRMRNRENQLINKDAEWIMAHHVGGTNSGGGSGENNTQSSGDDTIYIKNGDDVIVITTLSGTTVIPRNDYNQDKPRDSDGLTACFPGFSKVKTIDGFKFINEIKSGDCVISYNTTDNKFENTIVLTVDSHIDKSFDVFRYNFSNNLSLHLTEDHPILRKDSVFIKAKNLLLGDGVFDENGKIVYLESIELIGQFNVYNLIVEKNESYIVDGIVVRDR